MNYTSIRYKEGETDKYLPEFLVTEAKKDNVRLYGAYDDDNNIHVLFMVSIDDERHRQCIMHIYYDDMANQRMVGDLITYTENVARRAKTTTIDVQITEQLDRLNQIMEWFKEYDYDVVYQDRRYLIYELAQMRKTTFFEKTSQARKMLDKVEFYNQLTKEQLMDFTTKMDSIPREKKYELPDLVFGRYYVENGEIKGFMDIREVEEGVLKLLDSHIEHDKDSKYAFPVMLASALVLSSAFLDDGTKFFMKIDRENYYNGVKTAFGEASYEGLIHKYTKEL